MNVDEVMLIGGAKLYASHIKYCDRLYITEVDATIEGDVYFPKIDTNSWKLYLKINFQRI